MIIKIGELYKNKIPITFFHNNTSVYFEEDSIFLFLNVHDTGFYYNKYYVKILHDNKIMFAYLSPFTVKNCLELIKY